MSVIGTLMKNGMLAATMALGACSTATGQAPPAKVAPIESAKAVDPLGDFNGKRIKVGQQVVLDEFEYGVSGVGIVLKLFKINEQTYSEGGKDTVSTQAEINVFRGEEQKRLLVGEEEAKWAFGCKIQVSKARVEFIEKRQDWLPRATVTVTQCKAK